jgi:indolepyruvate ferredoxin oxidoreductase beta subunit
MNLNILIVGVGGQGTLLASKILGEYARLIEKDCKVSEVHGMSQRGGSVVTYVRMGEKIHSPLIDSKAADVIIAFEELEALRWANYAKDGAVMVVNQYNRFIENYPKDIYERLAKYNVHIKKVAGATNVGVLGFVCALLKFDKQIFVQAIKNSVKAATIEMNMIAFEKEYKNPLAR